MPNNNGPNAGFNYSEAFHLMHYACQKGCCLEMIWNSRDGVTPFIEFSKHGHEMLHINWRFDILTPDHKPCVGERIFVDATREALHDKAVQYVDKYWEPHKFGPGLKSMHATKELAVTGTLDDWCKPGNPNLIEVKENWPTLIA